MEIKLNMAEEKAGIKKILRELSIPPITAEILISSKKGIIIRVRLTVSSNLSGVVLKLGAMRLTILGEKIIPKITIVVSTTITLESKMEAISKLCFKSFFTKVELKTLVKADAKAPSAKRSLKRLGILYATTKASMLFPAPKKYANTCSLTKPRILLKKTAIVIELACFAICEILLFSIGLF